MVNAKYTASINPRADNKIKYNINTGSRIINSGTRCVGTRQRSTQTIDKLRPTICLGSLSKQGTGWAYVFSGAPSDPRGPSSSLPGYDNPLGDVSAGWSAPLRPDDAIVQFEDKDGNGEGGNEVLTLGHRSLNSHNWILGEKLELEQAL